MTGLDVAIVPILRDNYAYLLTDQASGSRAVIDPGEAGPVLDHVKETGGRLDWILLTHHHGDHTGGVAAVREATGCRVAGPKREALRIGGRLDRELDEGDAFELGQAIATIISTPGHTAAPATFHFAEDAAVFTGDTLFVMGCGRLIERDAATMWQSLQLLMALPDATKVYCGHEYTLTNARFARTVDPDNQRLVERLAEVEAARSGGRPTVPSTIALEKATNPFLRADDPSLRRQLGLESAPAAEVFAEIRRRKDAF